METTSSPTSSKPSAASRSTRQIGPLAAWLVLVALQIALAFSATSDDDAVRDPDPLFSWELAVGGTIVYAIVVVLTFAIVKSYPMDVQGSPRPEAVRHVAGSGSPSPSLSPP